MPFNIHIIHIYETSPKYPKLATTTCSFHAKRDYYAPAKNVKKKYILAKDTLYLCRATKNDREQDISPLLVQ